MAIQRLNNTKLIDVDPNPMMAVAICAVFFNIVLGLLLRGVPHSHGHSHGGSHGSHNHGEHVRLEDSFDEIFSELSSVDVEPLGPLGRKKFVIFFYIL